MFSRQVEKAIHRWIATSQKALLVSGARQVGKTYTIRKSLNATQCNYLEINLVERPDLVPLFQASQSVDDLILNLSAATNYSFSHGETILFLDEIQEVPDIVTKIKFWVDEGSFRYILSGSLLGVELKNLRSAPVGYLEEIKMFPLNFKEFLLASSVTETVIEHLNDCFNKKMPVNETVHTTILEHFRRYLVIGGMPDAVREYIVSKDMSKVTSIQQNIIEMYKLDFTKYEALDKRLSIISIYETMPSQILKQNRRFNYSDIKKGLRFNNLESSFLWLASAGVVIPTYNTTEPRIALAQNAKNSLLKLYSSDTGLLTSQYGNALRLNILLGKENINLGGIYENVIAQELHAHGFRTFFYNSHKNGELDFLIEENGSVIPIEVKSGKDYYKHSALSKALNNAEYEIEKAYVLSNCNVSVEDNVYYLPIYMCMFIKDNTQLPVLPPLTL